MRLRAVAFYIQRTTGLISVHIPSTSKSLVTYPTAFAVLLLWFSPVRCMCQPFLSALFVLVNFQACSLLSQVRLSPSSCRLMRAHWGSASWMQFFLQCASSVPRFFFSAAAVVCRTLSALWEPCRRELHSPCRGAPRFPTLSRRPRPGTVIHKPCWFFYPSHSVLPPCFACYSVNSVII